MKPLTKIISIILITGIIGQGCLNSKKPKEEEYLKSTNAEITQYILEDFNNDKNIDCITMQNGSTTFIMYKDTAATKGINIPGIDDICKPMSPEMVTAANNLRDAWNMFQYQKAMQNYNLEQNK
ncbi:MAG: hypothetical protein ACP5NV_02045 [Candidatus Woesearchaeota archaeon]